MTYILIRRSLLLLALVAFQSIVFSQDSLSVFVNEVTVTGNKQETIAGKTAHSVMVIDSLDLSNFPASSLSQLLNQLPGVHVGETTGNAGSPKLYSMRGGRENDVLILINGVAVSDESNISHLQDLNLIPVELVEHIEVTYGGAGTLHGSRASAGVINIILKESEQPFSADAIFEAGKWSTFKQAFSIGASNKMKNLFFGANYSNEDSNGFSAALDKENQGFDRDKADKQNVGLDLTFKPDNRFEVGGLLNIAHIDYAFDAGPFTDGKDEQSNSEVKAIVNPKWKHGKGILQANFSFQDAERIQYSPFSPKTNKEFARFESQSFGADMFNVQNIGDKLSITTGLQFVASKSDQYGVDFFTGKYGQNISADSASVSIFDPYAALKYEPGANFFFEAGSRLNHHNDYGNHLVYHGRVGRLTNLGKFNWKLSGGISTAFNTPTLYQLYSAFGNNALSPEESETYEVNSALYYADNLSFTTAIYFRRETNPIGFSNTTFRYANFEGKTFAQGLDARLQVNPFKGLVAKAFVGFTDRKENSELFRLPGTEWGGSASLTPQNLKNFTLSADYRRVGKRIMPLFNSQTFKVDEIPVDGYNLLNLTGSVKFANDQFHLYGSLRNVLDEDIVENLGYTAEDSNVKVGLRYNFRE